MLIVTAGWTGARWAELAALRRSNLHFRQDDTGVLVVDPNDGALVESATDVWLTAPKAERTITLPRFLVRLLRAHLTTHDDQHVFTTPQHRPLTGQAVGTRRWPTMTSVHTAEPPESPTRRAVPGWLRQRSDRASGDHAALPGTLSACHPPTAMRSAT